MSGHRAFVQLVTKVGLLFGALFIVGVMLAAIPAHRPPTIPMVSLQESAGVASGAVSEQEELPAAVSNEEKESVRLAVSEMAEAHQDDQAQSHHSLHVKMTEMRTQNPGDVERANEILTQLRASIEKYKDYHAAITDGYKIFLPNVPQPEYHFTKYGNGFLEAFYFDPSRPTSLLYRKEAGGYTLTGAMYTMPRNATEDQLNARIPLSVAMWHQHTNLCIPPIGEMRGADWNKFGLKGSIATQAACDSAGGRFQPVIFGWMVHVYPYEDSLDKIFAMHMD